MQQFVAQGLAGWCAQSKEIIELITACGFSSITRRAVEKTDIQRSTQVENHLADGNTTALAQT